MHEGHKDNLDALAIQQLSEIVHIRYVNRAATNLGDGNFTSVRPHTDAAVRSSQFHNSVTEHLNCSVGNIFVVIPDKIPVLCKLQFNAQLHYVIYCVDHSSGVQSHCRAICNLCSTFVARL